MRSETRPQRETADTVVCKTVTLGGANVKDKRAVLAAEQAAAEEIAQHSGTRPGRGTRKKSRGPRASWVDRLWSRGGMKNGASGAIVQKFYAVRRAAQLLRVVVPGAALVVADAWDTMVVNSISAASAQLLSAVGRSEKLLIGGGRCSL